MKGKEIVVPSLYLIGYFGANLLLTLHTKWLLSRSSFVYPWLVSGLHIAVSGTGAWLTLRFGYDSYNLVYSINIAMSNVSLNEVSLSFHQIVRSGAPFLTLVLEFLILKKYASFWTVVSLLPVIGGIVLTVLGEFSGISLTLYGLYLTLFGAFLSSFKGVVTNLLLVGKLKLHPLELIYLVSPLATLQCLVASLLAKEGHGIYNQYNSKPFDPYLLGELMFNATLAFFLNWVSFSVNKETSALTMTVVGNVKQAVSIGLGIVIFNTKLSLMNTAGIIITLAGGAWYSVMALKDNERKKMLSKPVDSVEIASNPIDVKFDAIVTVK